MKEDLKFIRKEIVNVACCFNEAFALPSGVMLQSLLDKCSSYVVIYLLLDADISEETMNKFRKLEKIYDCEIRAIIFELKDFIPAEEYQEVEKECERYTLNTLSRLFLPQIVEDADKILYLDGDMVVIDDVTELYSIDVSDFSCGMMQVKTKEPWTLPSLFLNGSSIMLTEYYNAGMIVMNLRKMREENLSEKIWRYYMINYKSLSLNDQDALNAVLAGDILEIPLKWNFTISHLCMSDLLNRTKERCLEVKDVVKRKDFRIIHYVGAVKPWHAHGHSFSPLAALWWDAFDKSLWADDNLINQARQRHLTCSNFFRYMNYKLSILARLLHRQSFMRCDYSFKSYFFK